MSHSLRRIWHRPFHLLITAGESFLLALLGMSAAFLLATIFDYRFALALPGICVLGLAAGIAISQWLGKKPAAWAGKIPWFALAGLSAAITTSIFFFASAAPSGPTGVFLLSTALVIFTYALWAIGQTGWLHEHEMPESRLLLATIFGALTGVFASFPLVEHFHGPLFTVWLASAGLVALALLSRLHVVKLALAGLSALLLLSAGISGAWDFTIPPHWSNDAASLDKPLYAHDSDGNSLVRVITRWGDLARTDIVVDKKIPQLAQVFKNGALSGLLPAGYPEKADPEQLRNYFPLIALPQQAGHAKDVLIINSSGGLEIKMAADSGIPRIRGMESNRVLKSVAEQHRELYRHLLDNPGIRMDYGDIRRALRQDTTEYDQIYITIPQAKIPGGTEPGILENYLYTQEAFRNYWARLRPGGMLVVLAGEELLYMRALLVAWEVLEEDRAGGNALLGQQAWGYRMVSLMPPVRPYHYLLMLAKGPIGDETAGRIEQEARNMMVEKLFGPGMVPPTTAFNIYNRPYYILYHPQGPAVARKALSDYMSWRLKTRVNLNTPTDQHPNFFRFADDMHPALKWLGAACSVLLVYIFLFPLGAERRLDNPANNYRPPLPVYLSHYLALSTGFMMSLVAITSQATLLTERAGDTLYAVVAAALLGAGLAVLRRQHATDVRRRWQMAALTVLVICGLSYWILANGQKIAGEWPVSARLVAIAAMTFPLSLLTTQLLVHGLDHLRRNLPVLVPWATVTYGLAAPVGAIAGFWSWQYWGWGTVWAIITGCYLVALGTGAYLRWPSIHAETKQAPAQS